jgi:uncharacterized membrane protein YoaT (DUF817 family)
VAALSVGLQNTVSYVAVAVSANLIGLILDVFKGRAVSINGAWAYPAEAYTTIFSLMLIFSLVAVLASFRARETHGRSIHEPAKPV